MNLNQFTPTQKATPPSNTDAKSLLGQTTQLRLNQFKVNGNTWTPQPKTPPELPITTSKDTNNLGLNIGTALKDEGTGAVKEGVSEVQGLGNFALAPFKWGLSKLGIKGANAPTGLPDSMLQDKSLTQEVGGSLLKGGELISGAAGLAEGVMGGIDLLKGGNTVEDALKVISPKLSSKETEAALAEGRGTGGGLLSKTKITPSSREMEVAKAVQGIVKSGDTGATNISNVKTALTTEAENLKNQIATVDHPYSFKELNSTLSKIEPPISIKGTAFEKQIGAVKEAAMDIAQKNGGTVSSLLDSRKEFDALVSKEYPNLYDKENAPMRNAITSIRNAMNDFIEKNLPDNVSFKNSLKKQSLFYDAIDNIAGNSVGETKTTGIGRFVKAHPTATKIAGGIATAAGGGALVEGVDALRGK